MIIYIYIYIYIFLLEALFLQVIFFLGTSESIVDLGQTMNKSWHFIHLVDPEMFNLHYLLLKKACQWRLLWFLLLRRELTLLLYEFAIFLESVSMLLLLRVFSSMDRCCVFVNEGMFCCQVYIILFLPKLSHQLLKIMNTQEFNIPKSYLLLIFNMYFYTILNTWF
jgi:hypothetical protein